MNTMLLNSCIVARVFFAFVKDGEPAQELKDKVEETGLQKRFVFTGFIKDPRTLYADMGILLLTSINEGTPVAIIEGGGKQSAGDLITGGRNSQSDRRRPQRLAL